MYIYTEWMFHEGAYVILINTTHWYVMYMYNFSRSFWKTTIVL